ncbi:hypothetical protein MTO96_030200 [Rhipicephalus appendiculatus]
MFQGGHVPGTYRKTINAVTSVLLREVSGHLVKIIVMGVKNASSPQTVHEEQEKACIIITGMNNSNNGNKAHHKRKRASTSPPPSITSGKLSQDSHLITVSAAPNQSTPGLLGIKRAPL